jgi:hypothetical protein
MVIRRPRRMTNKRICLSLRPTRGIDKAAVGLLRQINKTSCIQLGIHVKMTKSFLFIGYVLAMFSSFLFQTSCDGGNEPPMCKQFYSLSANQREKEFVTFDLDKQLVLFKCGMNLRPPEMTNAILIASGGPPIIPRLLKELEEEKVDEFRQYSIVYIFSLMSVKGHLRDHRDAIHRLRKMVEAMKSKTIRDMAMDELMTIEKENNH